MFSKEDKPFTLQKLVNLFCYIFFIIANGVQFARKKIVLTFSYNLTSHDFVQFQCILLLIIVIFNLTYSLLLPFYNQKALKRPLLSDAKVDYSKLLWLAFIATIIVLIKYRSNLSLLIFRDTVEAYTHRVRAVGQVDNSGNLLFGKVIKPIPFACLLIALITKAPKNIRYTLLILTLITNGPTAMSRNAAAMIWLPILILMFGKKLRHNIFMWFMIVALFVLFPFFNLFRRWSGDLSFEWSMDFFNDINFDASQLFMATIKDDLVTWGSQLLGVLLFWVPRKFWPGKPEGSGHLIVQNHHGYFDCVSMPYFAEGYINWGFLGLLLFVLFLSWLSARLDAMYWTNWRKSTNLRTGYYLILLGALIFIMRGDMLSSVSYTVGIMISYSLCMFLSTSFHFTRLRIK